MARYINYIQPDLENVKGTTICEKISFANCYPGQEYENCANCIKQYFEKKVEEE